MIVPAIALVVAMGLGLVVTPLVRAAAVDRELLDQPGGRKTHVRAIPRLGGAAMLFAFLVAIGVAVAGGRLAGVEVAGAALVPIMVGAALVGAVGLVDDLRDLSPLAKLAGQVVASVAVVALGLTVTDLATPWGTLQLGAAGPVVTVAWLVAVVNAVNLIDGLDGLAGGVALATLLAIAAIAASLDAGTVLLVAAAAAGALIAFLCFNRPPASIIMGDAGSMFLGMLLGTCGVALVIAEPRSISPAIAIVALGVPLADMTWAVVRRLAAGRSIFAADSGHIHHQLIARGLGQGGATLVLVAASAGLGLLSFLLAR